MNELLYALRCEIVNCLF